MKLNEKAVRWLEAELIVVLAIVLLLGVLFGYSLAMSRLGPVAEEPIVGEPAAPMHIGGEHDVYDPS
ncbi:hypothetical protein DRH29_01995 [candidate division Kazan bacterium]|uniref:Uncharacterized protein n=1 Tax=candidate division Kazan bacterium TaxID=2202143 RepID=A0A420ZD33_UNCK3|nr:MAG: hypothetical protein DRH29_01995 [candidate division Kazan bacterium]